MADAAVQPPILDEARALTDTRLEVWATRLAAEHPGRVGAALAYALRSAGKRVRPALLLASYRSAGGASPGIAGLAAAIEIVHTYSLVHDDLPCMDDDDQRRGRPTTHRRFDVPTATRVGWLLVPVAVEALGEAAGELALEARVLGRMATTLLEAAGIRGMIGGQWLDLEAEGTPVEAGLLAEIHRRKTAALIEAACVLGACAARARPAARQALAGYGREIGVAFQIADDVLDATATSAQLGKTAGRDQALAKSTYVGLLGVEGARAEAARRGRRAVEHLAGAGLDTATLGQLAGYIVHRAS
jgi:geranylgeranyl pyrophosphate synthase